MRSSAEARQLPSRAHVQKFPPFSIDSAAGQMLECPAMIRTARTSTLLFLVLCALDVGMCGHYEAENTLQTEPSPGSEYCWQHGGTTKAERESVADKRAVEEKREALAVVRVVDGDTVELGDGQTVRLIGIDAPESHESDKLKKDAERSD